MSISLKTSSDEKLLSLMKEGNRTAYEELYFRYRRPLMLYGAAKVSTETAEDLCQDLWVNLWERKSIIHVKGTVVAYLFKAMRNRIIDHLAKSTYADQYIEHMKRIELQKDTGHADYQYREKAFLKSIECIVNKYCPKAGLILRLRIEGYNNHEIAVKLNLSEKTVRNRHSLIVKYLQGKFPYF